MGIQCVLEWRTPKTQILNLPLPSMWPCSHQLTSEGSVHISDGRNRARTCSCSPEFCDSVFELSASLDETHKFERKYICTGKLPKMLEI